MVSDMRYLMAKACSCPALVTLQNAKWLSNTGFRGNNRVVARRRPFDGILLPRLIGKAGRPRSQFAPQLLQPFGKLAALLFVVDCEGPQLVRELVAPRKFKPAQFHIEVIASERRIGLAPGPLGAVVSVAQAFSYFR